MSEQPGLFDRLDSFATGGNDHGVAFLTDDAQETYDNTVAGNQNGGKS